MRQVGAHQVFQGGTLTSTQLRLRRRPVSARGTSLAYRAGGMRSSNTNMLTISAHGSGRTHAIGIIRGLRADILAVRALGKCGTRTVARSSDISGSVLIGGAHGAISTRRSVQPGGSDVGTVRTYGVRCRSSHSGSDIASRAHGAIRASGLASENLVLACRA